MRVLAYWYRGCFFSLNTYICTFVASKKWLGFWRGEHFLTFAGLVFLWIFTRGYTVHSGYGLIGGVSWIPSWPSCETMGVRNRLLREDALKTLENMSEWCHTLWKRWVNDVQDISLSITTHVCVWYALTLILNNDEVDTETCLIDSVHIFIKVGGN